MTQENSRTGFEIAVIGMSGRFPGARNIDEFWENLKNGVESISFFSTEELKEADNDPGLLKNPNYIRAKGFLADSEYFDAAFFDYTPKEAELLDPQIRILHECACKTLENAGYNPELYNGLIGLFAGASYNGHWIKISSASNVSREMGVWASEQYIDRSYSCMRVSYKLNLRGPSFGMYTACSTSLVAIHLACQSILNGECDMALAGGVSVMGPSKSGHLFQEGMVLSPDGHCRTFDAKSAGIVLGSGIGIVVLKRLEDAIADNDHIHAIVLGSAINNDGLRKSGFTAPSTEGQEEVIRTAQQMAHVEPESISYIETHGTATNLGDSIEVEALKSAFNTNKKHFCGLGSVKTNIGHLDTAAGVASFIKTVLALKHCLIPPSLHFETPNPNIDFENSPFYVNWKLQEWKSYGSVRRAGVTSFGIGGTNAHVVLEEWHEDRRSEGQRTDGQPQLILLSAKTETALDKMTENLTGYLKKNPGISLPDVAYTLQLGRRCFPYRRMAVCQNVKDTLNILSNTVSPEAQTFLVKEENPEVVFMFPGQGAQYVNMGLELYRREKIFQEEMDRCFDILNHLMEYDIKEILYPQNSVSTVSTAMKKGAPEISQTEITQPVLFVFEYALAKLLIKWGIKPYAMIGHSIGEYVAACLSGVFSLEDALKLVSLRGKLMQRMPAGAMRSISLSEVQLKPFLSDHISLAAVNSSNLCVISGTHEAVESWAKEMESRGYNSRQLHTSHAFHSGMMDPILKEFEKEVGRVTLNRPKIPFISNVTGYWLAHEEAVDPGYWSKHLRQTVRFYDGLKELLKKESAIFVEVGPGKSLSTFMRQHKDKEPAQMAINLVRHPHEDVSDSHYLLSWLGQWWLYGGSTDWAEFYSDRKRHRVPLPTYPFEGQYYWIKSAFFGLDIDILTVGERISDLKKDFSDWFYIPSWKRTAIPVPGKETTSVPLSILLFTNESSLGIQLRKRLQDDGGSVIIVKAGDGFTREKEEEYTVKPGKVEDYQSLLIELRTNGMMPNRIIHLWNITRSKNNEVGIEENRHYQELGFYSLLCLARALEEQDLSETVQITVLTTQMQEVNGAEALCPAKATLIGPVMIIPLEYANIDCCSIDIGLPLPSPGSRKEERLINRLMGEIASEISDRFIAYQGIHRLVRTFEPVRLDIPGDAESGLRLKQKGVYLVTGGLGGIGLVLAKHLAASWQARLILTGRSAFPPPEEWEQWLSGHGEFDTVSRKIRTIREMESFGAEVLVYPADVSDYRRMENLISLVKVRWGNLNGIIHCAGVPGGGMIQRKRREVVEEVWAPKVTGTLVLDRLLKLKGIELDFMLLCSSVNSLVPMVGQVDYCAANAFLDAFAYYKTARDGVLTVSVNWDTWREVGMAVEAARGWAGRSVGHPLLDRYEEIYALKDPDQEIYLSRFTFQRHWVLHEHMTADGQGVVPGTTYLEMVRAAFEALEEAVPIEISDVRFLTPLMVSEGEEREVALILKRQGSGYNFLIASRRGEGNGNGGEGKPQNHAVGNVCRAAIIVEESTKHELEKIESLFSEGSNLEAIFAGRNDELSKSEGLLVFGPRWESLKWVKHEKDYGLAFLQLGEEYMEDLHSYKLHPALLDIATAFLYRHIDKQHAYIPFSYKRLIIKKDLPGKFFSYCRRLKEDAPSPGNEFVKFNVTLMDEEGMELVEVEEFSMLAVSEEIKDRLVESASVSIEHEIVVSDIFDFGAVEADFLKNGILPPEGIDAFRRIAAGELPQVVVSTIDLNFRIDKSDLFAVWRLREGSQFRKPPGPTHVRPELRTAYAAPETKTQQVMAEIWQELLGIRNIGIYDDFFELGGDSLKAISVTGKIHKEFNIQVTLAELFKQPTILKLSQYIADISQITGTAQTIFPGVEKENYESIPFIEEKEYYNLTPSQRRIWIVEQLNEGDEIYDIPHLFQLKGNLSRENFQKAFERVVQRHESLRTVFLKIKGEPKQKIFKSIKIPFYYLDFRKLENKEEGINREVEFRVNRLFDLEKGPLFEGALIRETEDKYTFVFNVHHIVFDRVSSGVLLQELFRFYSAYCKGEMNPLEGMIIQYKDYAAWLNRVLGGDSLKSLEEYWLGNFRDPIPILELPSDRPRPADKNMRVEKLTFFIDEAMTTKLDGLCKRYTLTLFMVQLAFVYILMVKYTGQTDIVFTSFISGRNHKDLEPLIGYFVNLLALRIHMKPDDSFSDLVRKVKQVTLESYEHQLYPFEDFVEKLHIPRERDRVVLSKIRIDAKDFIPEADFHVEELKVKSLMDQLSYPEIYKEDLYLCFTRHDSRIKAEIEYYPDMYDHSRILLMKERYIDLMGKLLNNEEIGISDIDFTTTDGEELGKDLDISFNI